MTGHYLTIFAVVVVLCLSGAVILTVLGSRDCDCCKQEREH